MTRDEGIDGVNKETYGIIRCLLKAQTELWMK